MNHLLGPDRKYLAHSMHLGFVAILMMFAKIKIENKNNKSLSERVEWIECQYLNSLFQYKAAKKVKT